MAPTNTKGMTYQMKEKHLNSLRKYFVGGVNISLSGRQIINILSICTFCFPKILYQLPVPSVYKYVVVYHM
jgi:hypothetical protein